MASCNTLQPSFKLSQMASCNTHQPTLKCIKYQVTWTDKKSIFHTNADKKKTKKLNLVMEKDRNDGLTIAV